MPQPDSRRIADILQRDASYIAESAAQALGPLSLQDWTTARRTSGNSDAALAAGDVPTPRNHDEASRMVVDGFRRLGNVVAVSVLVDEPGLIADDLMWLERMGSALALPLGDIQYIQILVRTYLGACALVLNGGDLKLVEDVAEQALQLVSEERPS